MPMYLNVALFFSLSGDASKDAERRLLLGYAVHREKVRERGGSVKIKSHGLKIEWTLKGSFLAVSTPIFANKYSLEISWRDLQALY